MRNLPIYILMFTLWIYIMFESFVINNLLNRVGVLEQQIESEQKYSPRDVSRLKELFYKENQ